jgi:hypothetical protein
MRHFIANLAAVELDIEVPSNPHFICSKDLHHTNHSTVARLVNDGLKVLWPTRVHRETVLILYSAAAAYMLKAVTALKVFCPNLIHFTCLSQGLRYVTENVRADFLQVHNQFRDKKVFLKAPRRVQSYKQHLPECTQRSKSDLFNCLHPKQFRLAPGDMKRLETQGLPLQEFMDIMKS